MRRVMRQTRQTLAAMTLALAGCSSALSAPTPTPELVALYFTTDSTTSAMLGDLAANYHVDRDLIAIVDRSQSGYTIQEFLSTIHDNDTTTSPEYAITTYLPDSNTLWAAPLGYDGIAIITHPQVAIESLSADDLRRIFTGQTTNWQALGTLDQEMVVVTSPIGSSTERTFSRLVMGQRAITLTARLAATPAAMLQTVAETSGAIGFVPFSQLDRSVNVVPVKAVANGIATMPDRDTIADGRYPLQMPVLMVGHTAPIPGDGYYEFILWTQQGEGRSVISRYIAPLPLAR